MPGSLGQSGSALAVSQATNCDALLLFFSVTTSMFLHTLALACGPFTKPSACTSMDRVDLGEIRISSKLKKNHQQQTRGL